MSYILKLQTQEYRALPEAEQMVMCMADAVGIFTVPHGLIQSDGTYAYITKRVDRQAGPDQSVRLLVMEHFCQLNIASLPISIIALTSAVQR